MVKEQVGSWADGCVLSIFISWPGSVVSVSTVKAPFRDAHQALAARDWGAHSTTLHDRSSCLCYPGRSLHDNRGFPSPSSCWWWWSIRFLRSWPILQRSHSQTLQALLPAIGVIAAIAAVVLFSRRLAAIGLASGPRGDKARPCESRIGTWNPDPACDRSAVDHPHTTRDAVRQETRPQPQPQTHHADTGAVERPQRLDSASACLFSAPPHRRPQRGSHRGSKLAFRLACLPTAERAQRPKLVKENSQASLSASL